MSKNIYHRYYQNQGYLYMIGDKTNEMMVIYSLLV